MATRATSPILLIVSELFFIFFFHKPYPKRSRVLQPCLWPVPEHGCAYSNVVGRLLTTPRIHGHRGPSGLENSGAGDAWKTREQVYRTMISDEIWIIYNQYNVLSMIMNLAKAWYFPPCSSGIILCVHPANERRRYNVTSSLIGWAHTQNTPCSCTAINGGPNSHQGQDTSLILSMISHASLESSNKESP